MRRLILLRHATRPFDSLGVLAHEPTERAGRAVVDAERSLGEEVARLEDELHGLAGSAAADPLAAKRRAAILALKRDVHNQRPLRDVAGAALQPSAEAALDRYRRSLQHLRDAEDDWARSFADGLAAGRRALAAAIADPLVAAGIASASSSLAAKLRQLGSRSPDTWGHGERHVAAKAAAYVARFATKTSPNSVFCAVGLAWAGAEPSRVNGSPAIARLDVSLSIAEARKVACVLAADVALSAILRPRANPTLRDEDGALSFWRYATLRQTEDNETLSRVKDHPVLRIALEAAASRPTLPELVRLVAERAQADESAVEPFLRQMIDRGVLLGEIEIPFNERRPLRFVAERAARVEPAPAWVEEGLAIETAVDRLSGLPPGAPERVPTMAKIAFALEALPHVRPLGRDELFRIDAASSLAVALPASVLDDLRSGLHPYLRLFAALYPARRYLQGWVDRFLAKFPADVDVPLLDVYRAITEQDDSYRPAAFPEPAGDDASDPSRRALAAVRDHVVAEGRFRREVTLDSETLDRLIGKAPDPHWACGVLFQIAARSDRTMNDGEHRIVLNGLFHGAGLSLSRFAHLLGTEVIDELRRAWSVLDRPGAIVAELTYNHLGRTANAGLRPAIFAHEIELPGDCASPGAAVFALRDLAVRWDPSSDRFALRRIADGTEVIPVINSGVNPVGFVSFLVAIGEQSLQPVAYFPGFDRQDVTHWPRVLSGRLVVFRERWSFAASECPEAPSRGDDPIPFARAVLSWRARLGLPRHVFVHTSKEPKPRYTDLDGPVFLDLFRRDLASLAGDREARVHVTEMLPAPDELFAGGHASEFLVQMDG
jgi:hypothetical protein